MKILKTIIFIAGSLLIIGIGYFILRGIYNLKALDDGRLIRFNKMTGEIVLIEGADIRKFDNNFIHYHTDVSEEITRAKTRKKENFLGYDSLNAELTWKWKEGHIVYSLSFGPYVAEFDNARMEDWDKYSVDGAHLNIFFLDTDGFSVIEGLVYFGEFQNSLGKKGIPVKWTHEDSARASISKAKEITDWSYSWRLSSQLSAELKDGLKKKKTETD